MGRLSLSGWIRSVPYPFRYQMAKVERGETVWKFVTGPEMGVPKAATRGRRGTDRPLLVTKEARSRSLRLFSKQFRKVNSPKFTTPIAAPMPPERYAIWLMCRSSRALYAVSVTRCTGWSVCSALCPNIQSKGE